MLIQLKDSFIFFADGYDVKQSYNIKDIRISVPVEPLISDVSAFLGSEKYNLTLIEGGNGADIYSIELKNKIFDGGVVTFMLLCDGAETNKLDIKLNGYVPFAAVYDLFFDKITDDMYMELTKEDTFKMVQSLLLGALSYFEFPRVNIYDFDENLAIFNTLLSHEEKDIIATYMVMCWISQQLASIENTRMKYSGSDFKFTSQANHMAKLQNLKKEYERMGFHLQRLYKRRKADEKGIMRSTFGSIMNSSSNKE